MIKSASARRSTAILPVLMALSPLTHSPVFARDTVAVAPVPVPPDDWLYAGSDIPRDAAWKFGTLPNGLRFAVRNNGVPPGQVSIRVRINAGSLAESDAERGYAHLLEHLAFRGSEYIADGEAKRIWQRFGATFGSDNNAQTTPTHTSYQLDLPDISPENLDEGLKYLSGMVRAPRVTDATVAAERAVVLAELRESAGPQMRVAELTQAHLFQGQRLEERLPIGTPETLGAATGTSVSAFHKRWYRPESALVVIVGDGSPDSFAALIAKHFGDWKAEGPASDLPGFGDPNPKAPVAKIIVEPSQPLAVTYAKLRPWRHEIDTMAYTRQLYLDFLAVQLINRRLETRARAGGKYLVGSMAQEVVSRSGDLTTVSIVPIGDDWAGALAEVRAVLADAETTAPSRADIDREINEISAFLQKDLQNAQNEPGARLADDMVRAVDIGETVTSPEGAVAVFKAVMPFATPKALLATTKRLLGGAATRLVVAAPKPVARSDADIAALAVAPVAADKSFRLARGSVSFRDLPPLGNPGTIVDESEVPGLQLKRLTLSNGVMAVVYDNDIEPDKVRVNVRFGSGYHAVAGDKPNLLWTGDYALTGSGIGKFGQNEIDQLTNGRQIEMQFSIDDDAFELSAESKPADLADQLHLFAAKLATPGWDAAPVARLKAGMLTGFDLQDATPGAVIDRDLTGLLRSGDSRWTAPTRAQIEALTPTQFRAFWEPLLKSGPIEVQLFGDVSKVDYRDLLVRTFGALPARADTPASDQKLTFPAPRTTPLVISHKGDADQAAALVAWPTGSGYDNIRDATHMEVVAAIFNDRLFDRLRAEQGASYSPLVTSQWPRSFDGGGYFLVGSLLAPKDMPRLYALAEEIAADLTAKPVSADELARNAGPLREQIARASTGNLFWMLQLEGVSRENRQLNALRSTINDTASITAEDVQRLAGRYLKPGSRWSLSIVPQGGNAAADANVGATLAD